MPFSIIEFSYITLKSKNEDTWSEDIPLQERFENAARQSLWPWYRWRLCVRGSRKFYQRGSNTDVVFFLFFFCWWDGGWSKCHLKWAIIGPPLKSARQWKWRFAGVPIMVHLVALWFKGIRINIARKPYIFVIFQGGPYPQSPFWIRPCCVW